MTAVTAVRLRSVVCAEMSYSGEMKAMFPGAGGPRCRSALYWNALHCCHILGANSTVDGYVPVPVMTVAVDVQNRACRLFSMMSVVGPF